MGLSLVAPRRPASRAPTIESFAARGGEQAHRLPGSRPSGSRPQGPPPPTGGVATGTGRRSWDPAGLLRIAGLASLLLAGWLACAGTVLAQEAGEAGSSPEDSAAAGAPEPAAMAGKVLSATTAEPIEGAVVSLLGSGYGAITDSTGSFRIPRTVAGRDTVQVRYIGYTPSDAPIDLEANATTRVVFLLSPTVLRLVDLEVEIDRGAVSDKGFEDRRRLGFGVFLDREEIEARNPEHTSDLFRRMNGVDVRTTYDGEAEVYLLRMGQQCRPVFFVDGTRSDGLKIDEIQPRDIDRIEVFRRGSEAPPQYNIGDCGTVLIWLRAGEF